MTIKTMEFKEKYTTEAKIKKDTTGTEEKKEVLSSDTFALGEEIENLKKTITNTARLLIK